MEKCTKHCDFCEKQILKNDSYYGLSVNSKFSETGQGWGRSEQLIDESSELCSNCYAITKSKVKELKNLIKTLKSNSYSYMHMSTDDFDMTLVDNNTKEEFKINLIR